MVVATRHKAASGRDDVGEGGSVVIGELQHTTIKRCCAVLLFEIEVLPESYLCWRIVGKGWRVKAVIQQVAGIDRVSCVWRTIRRRHWIARIRGYPEWEPSHIYSLSSHPSRRQHRWAHAIKILKQQRRTTSCWRRRRSGRRCGTWRARWGRRRASAREREWVRVQVELVQRAIRIRAVAVRVVRPHRVELSPVRIQTNIVTKVNAVARRRGVGESTAQAHVWRPSGATVCAERAVVFSIIVRYHVRSA